MFAGEAHASPPAAHGDGDPATGEKTLRVESSAVGTPFWKKMSMAQMTTFAAGALALFMVIGGAELFDRFSDSGSGNGGNGGDNAATESPGKLTPREFYLLDRDRSGYLTPEEVKGDAVIEQNFRKLDRNHDGRLSLEEFTSSR